MIKKITLKLISIFIGVFSFMIFYVCFTLFFHSIIFSHYGGINLSYYFLVSFLLYFSTALFSDLLSIVGKSTIKKTFISFGIASLISFVFLVLITAVTEYVSYGIINPEALPKVIFNNVYYFLMIGLALQIIFLSKFVENSHEINKSRNLFIGILGTPFLAIILFSIINFQALKTEYSKIPEGQIFLFHSDLESHHIRIIYGEKAVDKLALENDSLLFDIPKSGILIVPNEMPKNNHGRVYYAVDRHGKREKLNRSSYQIVHGYNSRDDKLNPNFLHEKKLDLAENIEYENIFVDLENVNENLFFEEYIKVNEIDINDYFYEESTWLRKYRELRDQRYDSLSIEIIRKVKD